MAGITYATAQARLTVYLTAEERVLANQSYSIGDRQMTRANLGEIREGIAYWDAQCQKLSGGRRGRGVRYVTPVTD